MNGTMYMGGLDLAEQNLEQHGWFCHLVLPVAVGDGLVKTAVITE